MMFISLAWLVIGLFLFWSIQQGKAWATHFLLGTTAAYSVWYWTERLVWQNPHPNWQFAVIVNLALILFILYSKKSLAREAYERKIENPKIE
jgi:multisubunit Na+/H+ antiporter MnhE subunit